MTVVRFILLLLLAGAVSAAMFVLLSLLAFYVGWYFVGLTGHPAMPDAPSAVYLAYAVVAPLLCLWAGVRVVFGRAARHWQPGTTP